MTVPTENNRKISTTDGVATSFPFDFQLLAEGDFKAKHYPDVGSPVALVLSTDFTLNAGPWPSGGTMTTIGAPLAAGEVVMYRDMTYTQGTDLTNNRRYNAEVYESALDNIILLVQQLKDAVDRSVVQDLNATISKLTLPPPSAGLVMVGNSAEDGWEDGPSATEISNAQTYAIAAQTAQGLSEDARDLSIAAKNDAETAVTNAQTEVTYAAEWANKAEDSLVSVAAGGDGVTDYSSLHWAAKAAASAATSADLASAVSGTDTYTATLGISSYTSGKTYYLSFANTNTIAAPTINFDTLGAKTIKNIDGLALPVGSIPAEAFVRYDGADMILLNPAQKGVIAASYAELNTTGTGTTDLPFDDTIPQNTEGDEILTVTHNRVSASSQLYVSAKTWLGEDSNVSVVILGAALFQDAIADAIDVNYNADSPNGEFGASLQAHELTLGAKVASGSTGNTTFKLRVGLAGAGAAANCRWNGVNGGRKGGGAMKTFIQVLEVLE
jgi:hypothetical protein